MVERGSSAILGERGGHRGAYTRMGPDLIYSLKCYLWLQGREWAVGEEIGEEEKQLL